MGSRVKLREAGRNPAGKALGDPVEKPREARESGETSGSQGKPMEKPMETRQWRSQWRRANGEANGNRRKASGHGSHVSHNQNLVHKWCTQNHVKNKEGGSPQLFVARGSSLTHLHLPESVLIMAHVSKGATRFRWQALFRPRAPVSARTPPPRRSPCDG